MRSRSPRAVLPAHVQGSARGQFCCIVKFFAASSEGKASLKAQKGRPARTKDMIPCDFCLEKPQSAEKRCLTCEAALCQAHLRKHNSKTTQKDHTLVTLSAGGSLEKCSEPAKLLECFCHDDLACIGSICSITDSHKDHNVVSLKEERDKQMAIFSLITKSMQENKTAMNQALVHLQKSEDQIKKNKKTLTDQLSKLFQEIKSQIDQKEKQILGDIESNEKKQLTNIMALKKQVEGKRDAAVHGLQELQTLTEQINMDFQQIQERIKKQNFSSDSVEVLRVHLDQAVIQDIRSHTEVYISNLDTLMQVVHGKIINQTRWSRAIPAAEFSLDDVICEVFPSPL